MSAPDRRDPQHWLDRPEAGAIVFRVLVAVCAALAAADLVYDKHGHYGFEGWFGFHGAYGFVACVSLVLVAKELRKLVKRDEDYYD